MGPLSSEPVPSRSSRAARTLGLALAGATFIAAAVSLLGWMIPVYSLIDWDGDGIVIKFNTALAITLGSAAAFLAIASRRTRTAVRILAAIAGLIGFATLFE